MRPFINEATGQDKQQSNEKIYDQKSVYFKNKAKTASDKTLTKNSLYFTRNERKIQLKTKVQ